MWKILLTAAVVIGTATLAGFCFSTGQIVLGSFNLSISAINLVCLYLLLTNS